MTHPNEWHLTTRLIGRRTLVFPSVDSSNSVAAQIATDGSHDGLAVLALEQTAGRGQQGRSWQCPPGAGVLLSVAVFPPAALARPAVLTAWAAVAVCDVVQQLTGFAARIKWPNDVYLNHKKVAGILIERGNATVVGIGLNLNQRTDAFADLPAATSLSIVTGADFEWRTTAQRLLEKLDEHYAKLVDGDLQTLEISWRDRLGVVGQEVKIECINGAAHTGRLLKCSFDEIILTTSDKLGISLRAESIRHLWPSDLRPR